MKYSEYSNIVSARTKYFFEVDGNTVGWYDASDLSTITKDGSNVVSKWANKLGATGSDLSVVVGEGSPTWATPDSILFNRTNKDKLKSPAFTFNQPEMIYLVAKQINWASGAVISDGNVSGSGTLRQRTSSPSIALNRGANYFANNSDWTLDTYAVVRYLFSGASSFIRVNTGTATTGDFGTTTHMGGFTLGGRGGDADSHSSIQIKELILRKIADSDANQTIIVNYLKAKYSL